MLFAYYILLIQIARLFFFLHGGRQERFKKKKKISVGREGLFTQKWQNIKYLYIM